MDREPVDRDTWEAWHRAVYGCGAWERACRQAELLVAWHDLQGFALGGSAVRAGARPGPRVKWPWRTGPFTVGLLFWRAAHDTGVLVDRATLVDALRLCEPAATALAAGPVPDDADLHWAGIGSVAAVAAVGRVVRAHLADGEQQFAVTLGHRARELRATPDWDRGDWQTPVLLARRAMGRTDDLRAAGAWRPTAEERSAAGRTGPDLERVTARTPVPADGPPAWVVRAARVARLGPALTAVADRLPGGADGRPGPLAEVLGAAAGACAWLSTGADELAREWEWERERGSSPDRPADPQAWELAQVPAALRTQIEETEQLLGAVGVFLWQVVVSG
ncbi:hypothetical protein [Kitasatospora sp. NPDC094015]|uniref:hypothetical protein n=1 Tax=Kitasatospora sp. NPDC094015 TaxID=3155205 RepID=UPI00332E8F28